MKHTGLLFDLDGVIADTAKYHYRAWKEITSGLGFDFTEADNEKLKGVSRSDSFRILLAIGHIEMTEAEQAAYCEKKNSIYLSYINRMTRDEILPGVTEFLTDARAKGYKTALGSASRNSRLILEKLQISPLFDTVADGTVVVKTKPDPEVYIRCAQLLCIPCADCIVFEDAVSGIQAAHNGGMKAVGIGKKDTLTQADTVIPGFTGITADDIESYIAQ